MSRANGGIVVVDSRKYAAPAAACAADVLQALARSTAPLTVGQMADQTGCTRSLVYRVLTELTQRRLVAEVQNRNGAINAANSYRLGVGVVEMGAAYATTVPYMQSLRATLRDLADEFGETANLGVLEEDKVLYVMREEGERSVFSMSRVGHHLPANTTGIGKVLLSQRSDGEVRAMYSRAPSELRRLTDTSLSTMPALLADLAETRDRGYAIEASETVAGRCCIAVAIPVPDDVGLDVGLSVSTDITRFEEIRTDLTTRLLAIRREHAAEAGARASLADGGSTRSRSARSSGRVFYPE